ncbi:aldehyde dehydrogenase [Nocardia vaccinii]|uniref:aldehyde dehydrogenase n=1 Tax=Nocardia vaccinii TaxID=1822 RepID=UPI000834FD3B|nr:aldehyde dehydrogenase [Nocardia vaccinii]
MPAKSAGLYIDGKIVSPDSTAEVDVINPATEEKIGVVADCNENDVNVAVLAAAQAQRSEWAKYSASDRAAILRRFAKSLDTRGDDIVGCVTAQNGTPITLSKWANHLLPVESYEYFAGLAETFEPEECRTAPNGTTSIVRHEPVGVVGLIVPWNAPQMLLASKLGPALAAGNTVVIKPSPETSLDLDYLWEAAAVAGFPAGVINIVTGGRGTGQALVDHPSVGKISFTGSSAAGRIIGAACGAALKPVSLELGGKSAAVLLEDVDLDHFLQEVPMVCIPNTGQICYSSTRILAPSARYAEVVDAVSETLRALPIGDPLDASTVLGPLAAARQRDRVEGYIEIGKSEGARIATGGARVPGFDRGYFVQPTVFADVDPDMRIAQEEIFGPVVTVIPYTDESNAVAIANNSDYGLGGVVYGTDYERAKDIARRIETGTIGVNRYLLDINAPFGGYKASGVGRELGPESISVYQQIKTMYV